MIFDFHLFSFLGFADNQFEERDMEEREMKEREEGQLARKKIESEIGEIGEIGETGAGARKRMRFKMVLLRTGFKQKQGRAHIIRKHTTFDIAAPVSPISLFHLFSFFRWRPTNSRNEKGKNEKLKNEKWKNEK